MIYLIYGNKHEAVRQKVRDIVDAQTKKKPDALHFRVSSENWKDTNLDELVGGQGLFVAKYIVVFDHLLRDKDSDSEAGEILLGRLKEFVEAEHIFIFSEGELTQAILKKFEKKAEKIQELSTEEKKEKARFNIFSLTDLLGTRNKRSLWVEYQKALMSGVSPEEIQPILFWQAKAMLASVHADSAEEAGLNPFVYKKSASFARNFSNDELHDLASKLISVYHDTRRGLVDFETEMERFVLSL